MSIGFLKNSPGLPGLPICLGLSLIIGDEMKVTPSAWSAKRLCLKSYPKPSHYMPCNYMLPSTRRSRPSGDVCGSVSNKKSISSIGVPDRRLKLCKQDVNSPCGN